MFASLLVLCVGTLLAIVAGFLDSFASVIESVFVKQNLIIDPTNNVTIYDIPSPMYEGEEVEVKCKANGFPEPDIR